MTGRHIPPCDDPACDACWWDALDAEQFGPMARNTQAPDTPVDQP